MTQSEQLLKKEPYKNLFQKMVAVSKEVTSVTKDAEITQGNSSYDVVTHDAVAKALHLPLANNGIVVLVSEDKIQLTEFEKEKEYQGKITKSIVYRADVTVKVIFVNADDPEDRIELKMTAYAMDPSDKAVGKAVSLAVKLILLKNFMLESKDQEEARSIENANYQQKQYQAKPTTHVQQRKYPISDHRAEPPQGVRP